MPTYFVGNVLPSDKDAVPEGDSTFDFTHEEAASMNLTGVPIRVEHEDGLSVGEVVRDWTKKDGSKWVVGRVNNDSMESRFASHAIQPSSKGHTLYKGLSLQHVHTSFSNGTTSKRPIEVSLCQDPRRPACNIRAVNRSSKKEYIVHSASRIQSTMSAPVESTPAPVEPTPAAEPAAETPAPAAEAEAAPKTEEDLMRLVVDQESELTNTKTALEKAQEELKKLQEQWAEKERNEQLATKSKAEALSKALVESWEASLPKDVMTDENKKAIFALAQKFPEESVKMMEIAHKASKKHASDIETMRSTAKQQERSRLEQQVSDIVSKKRRVEPQTTSVVHAASTKAAANPYQFNAENTSNAMDSVRTRNPQLFEALRGMSSGNLRDRMAEISKIMQ